MNNNQTKPHLSGSSGTSESSGSSNVEQTKTEKKFSCVCLRPFARYGYYLRGDANIISDLYERCSLSKIRDDNSAFIGEPEYIKAQECLLQNGYKYSHGISDDYLTLENWVKEI